ncbi:cupin domain-containing protein [Pseudodesulfovibrio sediminis]|uniref:Mannose-6-phosphate isomerase n=1 Tax=Pseudodesulfovibrio sediminis TaxID=2810563 RepID=A0ABM8HXY5_9BACT|nr:cupin domain-containing protein [Pseudodesulfovibrio sediminis]BCS88232.1 mannose-6-phosphate isomerase [Pseudodesulfovibrio sediminis]
MPETINLADKFALFSEQWSPKLIGRVNDTDIKIVKIEGEFLWHSHQNEDEMFFVINGKMRMQFRDREVEVNPGECIIVPRGVEHMPVAETETQIMVIEPAGTVNTGGEASDRTRAPQPI